MSKQTTPPLPLAELVKQLQLYVTDHGADHDEDCPEDDTCECSYKARNDAVNALCRLAALPLGRCETCREWQPIASAPKDGAYVLVCNATAKTPVPWVASYRLPMYGEPQNQTHYEKEWRTSGGHWMTTTHWMPLPTPPAAGEETRDGK